MPRQTLKKRPDGRYVCKYKGFSFYGRTQSEALAAREEYKKQEKYGRKPLEEVAVFMVLMSVALQSIDNA